MELWDFERIIITFFSRSRILSLGISYKKMMIYSTKMSNKIANFLNL